VQIFCFLHDNIKVNDNLQIHPADYDKCESDTVVVSVRGLVLVEGEDGEEMVEEQQGA